jgi:hypothetical protein
MARKYLRRYDDPRWRLWDEFVTLRMKIGIAFLEKIYNK